MAHITKEFLRHLFSNNKGKRLQMLYEFYKAEYFTNPHYSAEFIADGISKDLEVKIDRAVIYQINKRIIKKLKEKKELVSAPNSNASSFSSAQGNKEAQPGNVPKERPKFNFRNADDIPEERDKLKRQLDKAFEGL